MSGKRLKPVHPGEILRVEFLEPLKLNANQLAKALRVDYPKIYDILKERRGISTDMALRLAYCFKTTPEFWLNLQSNYDLEFERDKKADRIKREVTPVKAMAAD